MPDPIKKKRQSKTERLRIERDALFELVKPYIARENVKHIQRVPKGYIAHFIYETVPVLPEGKELDRLVNARMKEIIDRSSISA